MWDLPVLFLCENNLYSEMTPIRDMVRVEELCSRSESYGMPGTRVDGMDVMAVADAVKASAERARGGHGPSFIEAMTYRFCGHMPGDSQSYRSPEEVASWRLRDPLSPWRSELASSGVTSSSLTETEETVATELSDAERRALTAALPGPETISIGTASWMETER